MAAMYQVICLEKYHGGIVVLDEEEYNAQMMRADSTWQCPVCLGAADWDDNSLIS